MQIGESGEVCGPGQPLRLEGPARCHREACNPWLRPPTAELVARDAQNPDHGAADEFNAHFLDTARDRGYDIVGSAITFHPRTGVSKGGNVSNGRALRVGLRMVLGIVWGWRAIQA